MIHIAGGKTFLSLTWKKGCQHFAFHRSIQEDEMRWAAHERKGCIHLCFFLYNTHLFSDCWCTLTSKLSALYNALLKPLMLSQTTYYFLHDSLPAVGYICGLQIEKGTEASACIQNENSLYCDLPSGAPQTWISQVHSQNIHAHKSKFLCLR